MNGLLDLTEFSFRIQACSDEVGDCSGRWAHLILFRNP